MARGAQKTVYLTTDEVRNRVQDYQKKHPARYKERARARNAAEAIAARKKKSELFSLLGGKCSRCGLADMRCIHFHHANGNGRSDRRAAGYKGRSANPDKRASYYSRLIARISADPTYLVPLCANCHLIIHDEEKELNRTGAYGSPICTFPNPDFFGD